MEVGREVQELWSRSGPHAALVWPWRPLLLSGLLGGEEEMDQVAITMTTTDHPPPALAQGGVSEGPARAPS